MERMEEPKDGVWSNLRWWKVLGWNWMSFQEVLTQIFHVGHPKQPFHPWSLLEDLSMRNPRGIERSRCAVPGNYSLLLELDGAGVELDVGAVGAVADAFVVDVIRLHLIRPVQLAVLLLDPVGSEKLGSQLSGKQEDSHPIPLLEAQLQPLCSSGK